VLNPKEALCRDVRVALCMCVVLVVGLCTVFCIVLREVREEVIFTTLASI
jgi:hypothetical protein